MSFQSKFIVNHEDQIGYDTITNHQLTQIFGVNGKYVIQTEHDNQQIYQIKLILKSTNPEMMGCLSLIRC